MIDDMITAKQFSEEIMEKAEVLKWVFFGKFLKIFWKKNWQKKQENKNFWEKKWKFKKKIFRKKFFWVQNSFLFSKVVFFASSYFWFYSEIYKNWEKIFFQVQKKFFCSKIF